MVYGKRPKIVYPDLVILQKIEIVTDNRSGPRKALIRFYPIGSAVK